MGWLPVGMLVEGSVYMHKANALRTGLILVSLLFFLGFIGCTKFSVDTSNYSPVQTQTPGEIVSPLRSPLGSSAPIFRLAQPIYEGATEVHGTGPAGVPIKLVDVTEMGKVLGETTISDDGNFEFHLPEPLQAGHSVGLKVGDLSGTPFDYDDFQRGSTYYDRPLVGILLDMAPIRPAVVTPGN